MKTCCTCKILKSIEDFGQDKRSQDGLNPRCRLCCNFVSSSRDAKKNAAHSREWYANNRDRANKNQRAWRAANKEHVRDLHLKRYGLTASKSDEMLLNQDYRCAICGLHQSEQDRDLAVDHNHVSGKVRKLLCIRCNSGIGHFKDDKELVLKAYRYLEEHESKA